MKNSKIFEHKRNLMLFVSKTNAYIKPVDKIISSCNLEVCVIDIDDFCNEIIDVCFSENDVIYFTCCNSLLVHQAIKKISKCKIINKEFLIKKDILNKKNLQCYLQKVGILVPKIYDCIEHVKFPIFCKEKVHQGMTVAFYNMKSLQLFFEKFNVDNFYFEEALISDNVPITDFKIYYVNGKIYSRQKQLKNSLELKCICSEIAHLLDDLEIFSVDFIKANNEYKVIDINVCTSMFLCDEGRKEFIRYLNSI